ncbi:MAG TPA: pyridoxal phosphate-dependent aminotransferase, partial [Thermoanaerobaculia bacterium]|nr:pyridoxal phosphate-dependent aminotransferase [Thermoanaerobaculia bacterium]
AKSRPRARVDLAGSNLLACALEDLPGAREALEITGDSPNGYPPLVSAIAARYGVDADRVATAGGCSGANFLACAALLDAGDEVVIEWPCYDPLVGAVEMLGARPRFFQRAVETDFALEAGLVEKILTPSTRLIIVSNPHNPSGVLASDAEMEALARLSSRTGVPLLVDEVYLETVLDRRLAPAAVASPSIVSSNSLTKAYGLSTLRCGWTLASPEITRKIRRARDIVDVSGAVPAERLSLVALDHMGALERRARRLIEANRALFEELLRRHPALQCAPSVSTIAFPRFRDGRDAGPWVRRLFEEHGVAVVPGSFFGLPAHFRVSLGGATEVVRAGLDAIGRSLSRP